MKKLFPPMVVKNRDESHARIAKKITNFKETEETLLTFGSNKIHFLHVDDDDDDDDDDDVFI